eukprot:6190007-Pleurochrysis_carterae.AAC.2
MVLKLHTRLQIKLLSLVSTIEGAGEGGEKGQGQGVKGGGARARREQVGGRGVREGERKT